MKAEVLAVLEHSGVWTIDIGNVLREAIAAGHQPEMVIRPFLNNLKSFILQ